MASLASRFSPRAYPSSGRVVSSANGSAPQQSIKGVKQAAQLKLKAQRSLAASYTFKHGGQSYTLLRSTQTSQSRSIHTSRMLANTEQKTEEQTEEPIKKERRPDEPAFAPQGALVKPEWPPFGRYPYAWIGLTVASLFLFGYTWFIFREEKMIERYEFMKWGGELDRIHSLEKIRKYLVYDSFGIIGSGRMSEFGLAETTLGCVYDHSKEVQDLAVEVFCGFTANRDLQKYLAEELKGVDALRRFAFDHNIYMWYAVANLAEHHEAICKDICNDEFYMEALLGALERALQMSDYHMMRPTMRLLANLAEYPENVQLLSSDKYRDKLELLLSVPVLLESQSMAPGHNLRFRLVKYAPDQWPELVSMMVESGVTAELDPELTKFGLIHQTFATVSTGIAWSLWRAQRLKSKFHPLARTERAWIRSAVWRSPLTAVGLSFFLFGVERLAAYVSSQLQWETFRDARYAYAPYFLTLPVYWAALNYAGPFATIPSLVRIRYNERLPALNYKFRKPMLYAAKELGLIDEIPGNEPANYNRMTTPLNEIIENRRASARLQKEDAERVMKEQNKSKWFW